MDIYFKDRMEWRKWLRENHSTSDEVWVRYYKKPSGKVSVKYSEAVEEALCYGWIDGKIKRINDDYYIQRFTQRRPTSRWSQYNIDRVNKLIEQGQMTPAGLKAYQRLLERPELGYTNRRDGELTIPEDLMDSFRKNPTAYSNFMKFSQSGRRIYIEWLNNSKKKETRLRRILKIIDNSERSIRPGI
jgi:uncharacterized protein YdeI (YjbR/CyaY-like superfamily)